MLLRTSIVDPSSAIREALVSIPTRMPAKTMTVMINPVNQGASTIRRQKSGMFTMLEKYGKAPYDEFASKSRHWGVLKFYGFW